MLLTASLHLTGNLSCVSEDNYVQLAPSGAHFSAQDASENNEVCVRANMALAGVQCPEHTKTNSLNTLKPLSESLFPSSDGRPGRGQCDVVANAHTGRVTALMQISGNMLKKISGHQR